MTRSFLGHKTPNMGYLKLLSRHPRTIGFGFLVAFFSGLGQTHFVSLFSPYFMAQLNMSNSDYGILYSVVTLISGILISVIGPLIDRMDARYFGLYIGIGLLASQCLLLISGDLIFVALGLFGLRLFGQGLSSSLSSITIARYFNAERGKALALSQMGFPAYEGIVTPLFGLLLVSFSAPQLIWATIIIVAAFYIPTVMSLTRGFHDFNNPSTGKKENSNIETSNDLEGWTRKQVFSQKTIYFVLPQLIMPPFVLTGVFFHQAAIAESKGWALSLMASSFVLFAGGRLLNTFITGPIIDRYSARNLYPFYQLPFAVGLFLLASGQAWFWPFVAFGLFGVTVGSGGPIKSAIWAELYGVRYLGAIKSLFGTIMVISTAIGPALFGWWIDVHGTANSLLIGLGLMSVFASISAWWGLNTHPNEN